MRKYRIIEEKYEYVSHFYPQYRDDDVVRYVLGQDDDGKDITSGYQYFGSWKTSELSGADFWKRDFFYDLSMARHHIEIDIESYKTHELKETLKETIIHEF